MKFKVGDKVICINNDNGKKDVELHKEYTISNIWSGMYGCYYLQLKELRIEHSYDVSRFKKLIKRKDNPIIRKIAKVYKEENGYIYI